jgi:hypothetical protein
MSLDAAKVRGLIEAEISSVGDGRIVSLIRALLVEPNEVMLDWDYGEPGDRYRCWTVLNEGAGSSVSVVYCEQGFGPGDPWGVVSLGDGASMGMDSQWFPRFVEAFFNTYAVKDLPIWRVYSSDDDALRQPLTAELSWEDAWASCLKHRERHPGVGFHVDHPARLSE